ncbi:MAG: tetratricopeptide repeat protein [Chlorobiaceae bacterium]|nr:tetratricopeptide repeat protein [Chlorobiaceae bacterium]
MVNAAQIQTQFEQAFACHQQGDFPQAVALCEAVLAIEPNHVEALHLSGVMAAQLKQHWKSVNLIGKAIALQPGNAAFHCNLGLVLYELNALVDAVASFDKAIAIKPDYFEAYINRGNALQELRKFDEAVESFDKAIAIKPDLAETHFNRGNALKKLEKFDAAVESFDKAIAIKPDLVAACFNRGNTLLELHAFEKALASYDMAIALRPDYHEAYVHRGNALLELKRFEEALASYDKVIAIKPDHYEAYSNRGVVLHELKRLEEAIRSYDSAITIKPDFHEATLHKSLALLTCGKFRTGWQLYESRWNVDRFTSPKRNFSRPLWLGKESLSGKTILLHSEQGLGDTIQFCRYIPLVADLGAQVVVEAEESLSGLLEDLRGVSGLVIKGSALPGFDLHCPLISLPLAFRTELETIPAPHHYLKSNSGKRAYWEKKLGEKSKPRIGLAWCGSTDFKHYSERSIPLAEMIKHLPEGFSYVSLQKEMRNIDRQTLESNAQLLHFGDELKDFTDTAAICDLMDFVISIDTSVAHLSGALGKTTWVLLPFATDWRWMLDRDDSPWYPTMRLLRQQKPNDWSGAFGKLGSALLTEYGK